MNRKVIAVRFFRSLKGNEPVREWLKKLPADDKKIIGEAIKTVEFGWPLGLPLVRNLNQGLWEVRINLPSSRIARVMFCMQKQQMILLHGFIKKTQKTPQADMKLALDRMKKIGEGDSHE
ncbi:MAG: hypothetical protein COB50_04045 [Thiotrichales bacterium]|nr:MAG: hypothetical protein COB50_04045 [Thiotrichales bacterium]